MAICLPAALDRRQELVCWMAMQGAAQVLQLIIHFPFHLPLPFQLTVTASHSAQVFRKRAGGQHQQPVPDDTVQSPLP